MFIIQEPYVTYQINVTVQQLEYQVFQGKGKKKDVWRTVGFAEIGPQRIGQNTAQNQNGKVSGPKVNLYL